MLPPAQNVRQCTWGYRRDWDNEVSQLTIKSYLILNLNILQGCIHMGYYTYNKPKTAE
jgi:hypothetical protein